MLKSIRRRSKYNKLQQGAYNSMKPGLEAEFEQLNKDQNMLKIEILKLRQKQENSNIQLTNVQEQIQSAELKQHHMLFFLTKMVQKPTLVQQLIQKIMRKRELDGGEINKRRRLLGTQCSASLANAMSTTLNVEYRQEVHEELATLQSDHTDFQSEPVNTSRIDPPAPSLVEDGSFNPIRGLKAYASGATPNDVSFAYNAMSEKLMRENSVVDEELDVNDSNFFLELEDLIRKPADWGGSSYELVGQTGCV